MIEDQEQEVYDKQLIEFEKERLANTKKLNLAEEVQDKQRLSKRAKKRLQKLEANTEMDQVTKN